MSNTEKVERFTPTCHYTDEGYPEASILSVPTGDYVLHSDYAQQHLDSLARESGLARAVVALSRRTIEAVLHEVLDESDESLSAGTFDEIVDRLTGAKT